MLEHPTLKEAAEAAFEVLSIEIPELHLPVVKHLFQQKLFQICLKGLWHKLEKYSEHHLSAFIFVLKLTPHQAIRNNIVKVINCMNFLFFFKKKSPNYLFAIFSFQVGPVLFKCLLVEKKEKVILTALTIISRLIAEQEVYYRDNINVLITNCIKLSTFPDSMVSIMMMMIIIV